jgi:predicted Zn-dependent peptidase
MNWVGEQWLGFGNVLSPATVKRRLARVTARDIHAAARDFFRPERLNLALVSPMKSSNRIAALLNQQASIL